MFKWEAGRDEKWIMENFRQGNFCAACTEKCNNTTILSLFKEMEHFGLKCREKIGAIDLNVSIIKFYDLYNCACNTFHCIWDNYTILKQSIICLNHDFCLFAYL